MPDINGNPTWQELEAILNDPNTSPRAKSVAADLLGSMDKLQNYAPNPGQGKEMTASAAFDPPMATPGGQVAAGSTTSQDAAGGGLRPEQIARAAKMAAQKGVTSDDLMKLISDPNAPTDQVMTARAILATQVPEPTLVGQPKKDTFENVLAFLSDAAGGYAGKNDYDQSEQSQVRARFKGRSERANEQNVAIINDYKERKHAADLQALDFKLKGNEWSDNQKKEAVIRLQQFDAMDNDLHDETVSNFKGDIQTLRDKVIANPLSPAVEAEISAFHDKARAWEAHNINEPETLTKAYDNLRALPLLNNEREIATHIYKGEDQDGKKIPMSIAQKQKALVDLETAVRQRISDEGFDERAGKSKALKTNQEKLAAAGVPLDIIPQDTDLIDDATTQRLISQGKKMSMPQHQVQRTRFDHGDQQLQSYVGPIQQKLDSKQWDIKKANAALDGLVAEAQKPQVYVTDPTSGEVVLYADLKHRLEAARVSGESDEAYKQRRLALLDLMAGKLKTVTMPALQSFYLEGFKARVQKAKDEIGARPVAEAPAAPAPNPLQAAPSKYVEPELTGLANAARYYGLSSSDNEKAHDYLDWTIRNISIGAISADNARDAVLAQKKKGAIDDSDFNHYNEQINDAIKTLAKSRKYHDNRTKKSK